MKARPIKIRELVLLGRCRGVTFAGLAVEFGLPLGTVKTWCARARMKPTATKGNGGEMKPVEADKSVQAPVRLATFRGVTSVDLPGKDRATQSMNFFNLKRGTYPPKSAKIPGYLEGAELVAALKVWCGKWGKGGR